MYQPLIAYYQEDNGDFLVVDLASTDVNLGTLHVKGRAAAVEGDINSVADTSISRLFLQNKCKRVAKEDVHPAWQKALETFKQNPRNKP